ncbi:Abi-alpha family protein [Hymenobacter convexus]|uniref:Abi-alpha family protein n=1 Tax=Hymenobacter sp. CA1UV-4 TaxID=3063782 RepID=UPI002712EC88|nr:Abi-alpha family protein [Hymenobacter sp. CA1UV-4]MDO7850395.1 Abi-alpha family protein [Hymenobacter sp. CA1UV-4]
MPTDPLSTLALATGGAFLGKFVGPAAESIGKVAWERAQQLGTRAHQMLAAVGREPQPVEPKILIPLVQAAALESDETLAEKWAALLSNAADPEKRAQVQPGFVEVLRQLTPMDAQVLEEMALLQLHPEDSSISGYIAIPLLLRRFPKLQEDEFLIITGNIARLGLCLGVGLQDVKKKGAFPFAPNAQYTTMGPGVDYLQLTPFSRAFLSAVTTPAL